jgi:hypothetical protein
VDDFARLPSSERRIFFEQTAAHRKLVPQIIEKDFWVCWCLKRLFALDEFKGHLTFKGGTSLSKIYRAIERFSEDVDVAIERGCLGFGGNDEPEKGQTRKEQKRRRDALAEACRDAVANRIQPQLRGAIHTALGRDSNWSLTLDETDPDQQSLLFQYPPALSGKVSPYFATSVKIELGARSDHFPVEDRSLASYVSEVFPGEFVAASAGVRVLTAARTFWEKVTILHRVHYLPENNRIQPRMSRHYYDVYTLSEGGQWNNILESLSLLDRVVEQTEFFFARAWANYDEVRSGILHLSPPDRIMPELIEDYREMRPMFFCEPPPFDRILAKLPELEQLINESKR